MKVYLQKLQKTGGYSRKPRVTTMKGGNAIQRCNNNKKNLPTHSWLIGKKPIAVKKPKIKVIKSLLNNKDFIVKIEKIGEFRDKKIDEINNEVEWSKKLNGRTNFVNFVCNFLCNDQITKYKEDIKDIYFCDGKEEVSIIIMEYINGNTIISSSNNLLSKLNKKALKNFIKRTYYAIIQAYLDLDFLHNDLNGVNIMIRKTNDISQKYKIGKKLYEIETYGYEPIIIDFERSDKGYKNNQNLIEDITNLDYSIRVGLENSKNKNNPIYNNITDKMTKKMTLNYFLKLLEKW